MKQKNLKPKVAVLMATFNSSKFIEKQLLSIIDQKGVEVFIFISDDSSTDNTLKIIKNFIKKYNISFLENKKPFGGAGLNFYSLVARAPNIGFDYYCFSDHDDIWKPKKLIEGIKLMKKFKSKCYSSSFEAFDNDIDNLKFFSKCQSLTKYDYIFSSPGPGCSFIIKNDAFNLLQSKYVKNSSLFNKCFWHDWAIYAFFRSIDYNWIIDKRSFLLYRQHSNNVTGVNSGLKAYLRRLKLFTDKWYEKEVNNIINLVLNFEKNNNCSMLKKMSNHMFLFNVLYHSRRKTIDRIIIFILFNLRVLSRKKIFYN